MTERDPNEGSIDPMIPEYWQLGEAVQDRIISEGYQQESVDGIAVDIHDLLQAAKRIEEELAPAILNAESKDTVVEALKKLREEIHHIAWHCQASQTYLDEAAGKLA